MESTLSRDVSRYPFLKVFSGPIEKLASVSSKSADYYFGEFLEQTQELTEMKNEIIDPIKSFHAGSQKKIYDEATDLISTHVSNLSYISIEAGEQVKSLLADPEIYKGNKMASLKLATAELRASLNEILEQERNTELELIQQRLANLKESNEFSSAPSELQAKVIDGVERVEVSIKNESQIASIKQAGVRFNETQIPKWFDLLTSSDGEDDSTGSAESKTISAKTIEVPSNKSVLSSESDVDEYLDSYRQELLKLVKSGKRVSL
ncbi:MAG: hypothetical protein V9G25_09415 [Acidimicrobiia bacterium]